MQVVFDKVSKSALTVDGIWTELGILGAPFGWMSTKQVAMAASSDKRKAGKSCSEINTRSRDLVKRRAEERCLFSVMTNTFVPKDHNLFL